MASVFQSSVYASTRSLPCGYQTKENSSAHRNRGCEPQNLPIKIYLPRIVHQTRNYVAREVAERKPSGAAKACKEEAFCQDLSEDVTSVCSECQSSAHLALPCRSSCEQ